MTNARCRPERKSRRTAGPCVPRGTQGALSYGEAVFFANLDLQARESLEAALRAFAAKAMRDPEHRNKTHTLLNQLWSQCPRS